MSANSTSTVAPAAPHARAYSQPFALGTLALALTALVVIMLFGMLAGLLAGLAAFVLTRWLIGTPVFQRTGRWAPVVAATLVITLPVLGLVLAGVQLSQFASEAMRNYSGLVEHLVRVATEWRTRLPEAIAHHVPADASELASWLGATLKTQAPLLAGVGKTWAHGLLMAFVGLVVGALIAVSTVKPSTGPLALALRDRAIALAVSFRQIVLAQFWIATINTVFTAIFLLAVLPLFGVHMPYAGWLVLLTFVAGMLPIVGNLLCNGVIALAGLGVGPHVALACLLFLIAVHKLEYFINAKVVGSRMASAAWELLVAMFVFESLFGVAGLVAAPLYYAWLKFELKALGWV